MMTTARRLDFGHPRPYSCALVAEGARSGILNFLMIGIFVAAACLMETTVNIAILAPVLNSLAANLGVNEIQFCIMMITALGVGFIVSPLGLRFSAMSGNTRETSLMIAARAVPFLLGIVMVVLMTAYVPALSTSPLPEIYK